MIQVAPHHLQLIRDILSSTLPAEVSVLVFGSRAAGRALKYSDVDLALRGSSKVPTRLVLKLYGKFEESSLPYLVDIIDLNNISPDLADEVKRTGIKIWGRDEH